MVSGNNGYLVGENTALPRASHLPGKGRATLLAWVSEHFTSQKDKMCVKVQSQQSRSVEPGQSHLPIQYRGLVTRLRSHSTKHCLPAHLPFTGLCVNSTDTQHERSPIPDT